MLYNIFAVNLAFSNISLSRLGLVGEHSSDAPVPFILRRYDEDLGSVFDERRVEADQNNDLPESSDSPLGGPSPEPPRDEHNSKLGRLIETVKDSATMLYASSEQKVAWLNKHITERIKWYQANDLISPHQAGVLDLQMRSNSGEPYLMHFASQFIFTLPVAVFSAPVGPIKLLTGDMHGLGVAALTVGIINGGIRTAYTLGRAWPWEGDSERKKPYLALVLGFVPFVGDAGFLVEYLIHKRQSNHLAKFLLYDKAVISPGAFGKKCALAVGEWAAGKIFDSSSSPDDI